MFVTKVALSRRTVLRGLGTALALPFLDAMTPAFARGQQRTAAPLRFGGVYVPNGAPIGNSPTTSWMPKAAGELEITPILTPMAAHKQHVTVIGNLSRAGGKNATDHAVSSAGWLSGVVAKQTEAEDISLGITIDQVLAKHIGQESPFPSLEFATEDFSGYIGGCVPGYSCTYMNTISWAGETSPLPMEINPRVAFERMFGRAGDAESRLRRMRENRSILDSIADEARKLQQRVGAQDRARLSDYLDDVREIERRIQMTESRNAASVTSVAAPVGVPEAFEEQPIDEDAREELDPDQIEQVPEARLPQEDVDLVRVYLKHIGRRKLLTASQEQQIGREIELARGEVLAGLARIPAARETLLSLADSVRRHDAPAAELILLPDGGELKPDKIAPVLRALTRVRRLERRIEGHAERIASARSTIPRSASDSSGYGPLTVTAHTTPLGRASTIVWVVSSVPV